MDTLIILNDPPYGTERSYNGLRLGLFAFWGLSEDDGYIIPSVRYAFNDTLWGKLGANLFVGDRNGQFGALGDNDNIFATLRYAF
jgi:hypothetical protein